MGYKAKQIRRMLDEAGIDGMYNALLPELVDETDRRLKKKISHSSEFFGGYNRKDPVTLLV